MKEQTIMTPETILDMLQLHKKEIEKEFGIASLALFGSYARNEAGAESDIDILYTLKEPDSFSIFNYLKLLSKLENIFNKKVDLIRESQIKPPLKKYIEQDLIYV